MSRLKYACLRVCNLCIYATSANDCISRVELYDVATWFTAYSGGREKLRQRNIIRPRIIMLWSQHIRDQETRKQHRFVSTVHTTSSF